jgi:hypothetical protein
MSWDSSVDIATDYGLNDRMIGVRFPEGAGEFSRLALEPTQPPVKWAPVSLSLGLKHIMPSSKNVLIYTSTPPMRLPGVVLN